MRTSDGTLHQIDYGSLANNPIPLWDTSELESDLGRVLAVASSRVGLEWRDVTEGWFPTWSHGDPTSFLGISGNNGNEYLEWKQIGGTLPDTSDLSETSLLFGDANGASWGSILDALPDSSDISNKAVLSVEYGELEWVEGVMPQFSDLDAGKALTVSENGGVEWTEVVPPHDDVAEGRFLATIDCGDLSWVDPVQAVLPGWDHNEDSSDEGKVLGILNTGELGWISI